jgi:hypothetical protein
MEQRSARAADRRWPQVSNLKPILDQHTMHAMER